VVRCASRIPVEQSNPPAPVKPLAPSQRSDSLPAGLRLAQPTDADRLFDLCMAAYWEGGFGGRDDTVVRAVIARALNRESGVFGIIDGPDRIEAMLGLEPAKMWYGSDADWYWHDLTFFVHPLHRRSRHAITLFKFACWWERHIRMPVVLGVFPTTELELKEAMFERYGKRVGSMYLIGDGIFRTQTKVA
jgi:hypothetical protein